MSQSNLLFADPQVYPLRVGVLDYIALRECGFLLRLPTSRGKHGGRVTLRDLTVWKLRLISALSTPLLKDRSLDRDVLGNYHPVSGLSLLSKTQERVFLYQLNGCWWPAVPAVVVPEVHYFCLTSALRLTRLIMRHCSIVDTQEYSI